MIKPSCKPIGNYIRLVDERNTDVNWIINNRATARVAPTVSDIVDAYKSLVANGCLEIFKSKNDPTLFSHKNIFQKALFICFLYIFARKLTDRLE